jgi:hypothetical protein
MTDHLSERARQQLESLTVDERCAAIEEARWIGYMAANRALESLSKIRDRPKSTRTAGVAICGPYRNGKTMVADKFLTTATRQIRPTYYYQLPSEPSRLEFLTQMIRAMGRVPNPTERTIEGRRQQLEDLLDEYEPRVFIFDDAHHAFRGSGVKEFHTLLRSMGHRWDMSPVLIGDRSLAEVIHNDGELRTRLASCALPRWQYDIEYAKLLNSLVRELPLRQKSELTDEPLAKRIFQVSAGLIGDMVQNVAIAAAHAVRGGEERITLTAFDALDFVAPSKRFSASDLRGLS